MPTSAPVFHKSQIALRVQREGCVGGLASSAEMGQASKYMPGVKASRSWPSPVAAWDKVQGQIWNNHLIERGHASQHLQDTVREVRSVGQGQVGLRDQPGLQRAH